MKGGLKHSLPGEKDGRIVHRGDEDALGHCLPRIPAEGLPVVSFTCRRRQVRLIPAMQLRGDRIAQRKQFVFTM